MRNLQKVVFLVILVCSLNAFGQKNETAKVKDTKTEPECDSAMCEVSRTEREYNEVFASPTLDAFEKWHADDFYTISEIPSRITTRAEIVFYLKNFGTRIGVVTTVNTADLKIRLYENTAVTTGIWKTSAISPNGNPVNKSERFTRVWVKENKTWRLAASHYSPTIDLPVQQ
jgi:ketosteroid isomerase-like protein